MARSNYTSKIMERHITALLEAYPFLKRGTIGKSVLGKEIPYLRIGAGQKEVLYHASFHANEWITTPLLMRFIENYAKACEDNGTIFGYRARDLFQTASMYIVPMVNMDGVDLVNGALDGTAAYQMAQEIAAKYPDIAFPSGWKANIEGIDLNLQFPAEWETAKETKYARGFTGPAPRDYVGPAPLAAKEARAIWELTVSHDFRLILAYHTQGKTIYWKFLDYLPPLSHEIGIQFAEASGYTLEETPFASGFAGYKDWFIQEYNRPGYTIEAGSGVNPLPTSEFDSMYQENEGILTLGAVLAP